MLKQYLQQVCNELEIDQELSPSADGCFKLTFDQGSEVEFKENQDLTVFFHTQLTSLPKSNCEEYLALIMEAHLFGKETGNAFFGLDSKEEKLTLSQLLPPRLEYQEFTSQLEDFLNYRDFWSEETHSFASTGGNEEQAQ